VILLGDSKEKLKELPDNSIDAVVTDPPYGLAFMGKKWDYDVPSVDLWREVFRVLKPGGHVLSFGGTRTYHRMAVNIEDAGFEIRDQVMWVYGEGFPKSMNVGKALDKKQGNQRELIGTKDVGPDFTGDNFHRDNGQRKISEITKGTTQWEGWGTALKPANEPICLARKPLEKGLTVADNVLKWGTGAINVDGCRIGSDKIEKGRAGRGIAESTSYHNGLKPTENREFVQGRWPANILFDETAAEILDEQSGISKSGKLTGKEPSSRSGSVYGEFSTRSLNTHGDSGGASRFFYVAKASKSERNRGLEGMPKKIGSTYDGNIDHEHGNRKLGAHPDRPTELQANNHPTVKPIKLMEYLIKLITPPNGVVLDPFMGSGTTGVACKNLGFDFIGIELSPEYYEIAKKRIDTKQKTKQLQLDITC